MKKDFLKVLLCANALFALTACSSSNEKDEATATPEATVETTPETTPDATEEAIVEVNKFTVVSQSEYARDGKKCILYRVYPENTDNLTESDLLNSYNALMDELNDGYYLHEVMVYSVPENADGSDIWDIADIEETEQGKAPNITLR